MYQALTPQPATTVANSFIEYLNSVGQPPTVNRLMALMYSTHYTCITTDATMKIPLRGLIEDPFVAGEDGPLLPSVQIKYIQYFDNPITNDAVDKNDLVDQELAQLVIMYVCEMYKDTDDETIMAVNSGEDGLQFGIESPWVIAKAKGLYTPLEATDMVEFDKKKMALHEKITKIQHIQNGKVVASDFPVQCNN